MMTTLTVVPTQPRRIGPLDLVWLTWRQHRIAIITGAAFVAVFYALASAVPAAAAATDRLACTTDFHCGEHSILGVVWVPTWVLVDVLSWLVAAFALVIGVFWAAPLVAREYEQRTDALAWGQDVSATKWLLGKIAVLGTVAIGYGVIIAVAMRGLVTPFRSVLPREYFESAWPVPVAYVVFAFLLGVTVSAFVRRVVPAMGITTALFVAVRFVAYELRYAYLPPVRIALPPSGVNQLAAYFTLPQYLTFDLSTAVVGGRRIDVVDYQPADRLDTFRLIEIAIFVALTVILAIVTWLRMRPTRMAVR